jgi:dTDP-4-dehydrorhamnose 3,5-epimerase
MEILHTEIEGLLIIQPVVFEDERGYFYESYNASKLEAQGFKQNFIQDNVSKSQKDVLRGLHFQNPPHTQGKLVKVIKGAVLDVAVDLRRDSKTYGKHLTIELTEENKTQFYVPAGFAHGFLTLRDNTIFSYKCTQFYNKDSEESILWNDEDLNIDWGIKNPTISDKDRKAIKFSDFKTPF